ncbi:MAG: hypothetical protein RJA36_1318 [Pseudomonadota bacterium]|jgi:hypothetical protein
MTTTYELTTLRDVYEKVPADKIALCMREIADGMAQAKALEEFMSASADAIAPGASAATIWPDSCTWIDDGAEDKTINVHDASTDQNMFTFKVSKSA